MVPVLSGYAPVRILSSLRHSGASAVQPGAGDGRRRKTTQRSTGSSTATVSSI